MKAFLTSFHQGSSTFALSESLKKKVLNKSKMKNCVQIWQSRVRLSQVRFDNLTITTIGFNFSLLK